LNAKENINDGIGWPNLSLLGFLILNWTIVFLILVKGIKSAGKVSYITGIAPFIFLVIFLIRALTLPGSFDGIIYFFSPNWELAFSPQVWYAAATQLFFSLNVFFALISMYASYNKFDHNIYRDANVVTTIDTFTSIISGCISFAIIGHLKHELKVDDIKKVIQGGPGITNSYFLNITSNSFKISNLM
jgi:solute carrier family 6 amino acid transporter-like protein 5/7/9/14